MEIEKRASERRIESAELRLAQLPCSPSSVNEWVRGRGVSVVRSCLAHGYGDHPSSDVSVQVGRERLNSEHRRQEIQSVPSLGHFDQVMVKVELPVVFC